MYASVRKYRIDPASVDKEIQEAKDSFVPQISKMPGFVAFYHVNKGHGEFFTISIFEDKRGAEDSNKLAADWAKRKATSLIPGPPEITVGEVVLHKESAGTKTSFRP